MTHSSRLASLRLCTYIDGNLTLSVSNADASEADFEVFSGLEEIKGGSAWHALRH